MTQPSPLDPATLVYDDRGLLPVVVQGVASGAVLMLAYANQEAVERTQGSGLAWFWSRSRKKLWQKGESSGNELRVEEIRIDCDRDALLYRAHPAGPTCHRGTRSCFEPNAAELELGWLAEILRQRERAGGESSYTARLLASGLPRVAQKVGEEATEVVIAALAESGPEAGPGKLVAESADLLYHLLVLLRAKGVEPMAVARELAERHRSKTGPAMGHATKGDQDHA